MRAPREHYHQVVHYTPFHSRTSRANVLNLWHRWRDHTGCTHALRVQLRQHKLTTIAALPRVAGAMRNADASDLRWLIDAQLAFLDEARMSDSPEHVRTWLPKRVAR